MSRSLCMVTPTPSMFSFHPHRYTYSIVNDLAPVPHYSNTVVRLVRLESAPSTALGPESAQSICAKPLRSIGPDGSGSDCTLAAARTGLYSIHYTCIPRDSQSHCLGFVFGDCIPLPPPPRRSARPQLLSCTRPDPRHSTSASTPTRPFVVFICLTTLFLIVFWNSAFRHIRRSDYLTRALLPLLSPVSHDVHVAEVNLSTTVYPYTLPCN